MGIREDLPVWFKEANQLRVDWFRVIVDLSRAGYSHAAIGAAIDCPKSTVQGWKQGATPKYDDGELLITLWAAVMELPREQLPMVRRYDWRA